MNAACVRILVWRRRTDAEEQKRQQGDGVTAEFPAQRAGQGALLGGLHGGGLVFGVAVRVAAVALGVSRVASLRCAQVRVVSGGGSVVGGRRLSLSLGPLSCELSSPHISEDAVV